MTLKTIEAAALKLPAKARSELAATLLSSLETGDPAKWEQAWIEEAERRYRAYRSGETIAMPARDAITAAKAAIGK